MGPRAAMPSGQPLAPDAHHLMGEPTQAPTIPTDAIVGEVAPHHRGQAAMLVAERPMAVVPAPGSNCGHRAGIPVFGGHLPNHVLAIPRPPPNVGEAKEVEAGPIRLRMARALSSLRAEVDEARLVGVERESVPSEALAEDRQHAFGGIDVVER